MKEFSTILLIQTLRANVRCVENSEVLDPRHSGIRQFVNVIRREIGRLEGNGSQEPSLVAH